MSTISQDPLPLDGEQTLHQFCTRALKSGRSRNASAIITRIELLKDTRTTDDYWRHEYLVFTVQLRDSEDRIVVYFERGLANDGTWLDFLTFVWGGMKGDPSDLLTCYKAGSHEDQERRSWANSIIAIHLQRGAPGPLRLRHLAEVLSSKSYTTNYPDYRLLSANCWAWSRGVLFDIIRHPSSAPSELTAFDRPSSALVPEGVAGFAEAQGGPRLLSKDEVVLEILTNYGSYGKALLHFTSQNFRARYPVKPYLFHRIAIRLILVFYSVMDVITSIRNSFRLLAHSNWTVCLRTMHIYHTKTTDEKGWDFTSTYLSSNFSKLVPAVNVKAFKDLSIPNSLCSPGRYLYLLTPPLTAPPGTKSSVRSIHMYIFGSISVQVGDDDDDILRNLPSGGMEDILNQSEDADPQSPSWISCAVIRPSADGTSIRDVSEPVNLRLLPRKMIKNELHYSVMCVLDYRNVLSGSMRDGNILGFWAHGQPGWKNTVRIASVKIVTRRPFGILDLLFLVYVAWWIDQILRVGFSGRLVYGPLMCLPYAFNTRYEGWVWKNINIFANALHTSVARS